MGVGPADPSCPAGSARPAAVVAKVEAGTTEATVRMKSRRLWGRGNSMTASPSPARRVRAPRPGRRHYRSRNADGARRVRVACVEPAPAWVNDRERGVVAFGAEKEPEHRRLLQIFQRHVRLDARGAPRRRV